MPKLVTLYIRHVLIGFAIAAAFCVLMVWLDVAHLRHLVLGTDKGWIAALILFVSTASLFGGVQFAIAVMGMAEDETPPGGGLRLKSLAAAVQPVAVPVVAPSAARRR